MKLPLYLRVLLGLAVAACGWMFWLDTQAPEPSGQPQRPQAHNDRTAQTLEELQNVTSSPAEAPASAQPKIVNIFPSQNWRPPAPVVDKKAQAPQPPPMPFTVSAQWRYQDQQNIVVISGNGARYTLCNRCNVVGHITPGKKFDKGYRLNQLTDSTVVLTYLPLQHVTTLYLKKK